jgi:ATP-dependent DNA helicase RecG
MQKTRNKAQRKDIRELLWDKLPGVLTDSQKERKILTLLTALKRKEKITTSSDNKQKSYWVLTGK